MNTITTMPKNLTRSLLMINMERLLVNYGYTITGENPGVVAQVESNDESGYKGMFSYTRPDGTEVSFNHETASTNEADVSEVMAWRENITRTELDTHLRNLSANV